MPIIQNKQSSKSFQVSFLTKKEISKYPEKKLFEELGFEAKYKQILILPESRKIFIGIDFEFEIKSVDPFYKPNALSLGANLASKLKASKIFEITLLKPAFENIYGLNLSNFLEKFLLGILQFNYDFNKYKKQPKNKKNLVVILSKDFAEILNNQRLQKIENIHNAMSFTRDLVNDTPEAVNPTSVVEILKSRFGLNTYKEKVPVKLESTTLKYDKIYSLKKNSNLEVRQISFSQLKSQNFGGIVGVGKAGKNKPELIHAILKPKNKTKTKLVLVGKGITYDTGGLNVKTGSYMSTMKMDMAGAGTIAGILDFFVNYKNLKNVELHWISPFCENSISEESYRADDVLESFSGQTVEVINTDAEGRLILMDALSLATLFDPDYIVDMATLTGANIMALSTYYTGVMGNDINLCQSIQKSMENNLEYSEIVSLKEVLRETLKSDIADVVNLPEPREAGHTTAGLFLSNFIDQKNFRNPKLKIKNPKVYPWVHLDIAGSAYNEKKNGLGVKGATGATIPSLVDWIIGLDEVKD